MSEPALRKGERLSWRSLVRPMTTEHDFQQVARLRYRVYVEEMRKAYRSADHDRGLLSDPVDACSLILGAFDGDQLVGSVRSTRAADYVKIERAEFLRLDRWLEVVPEQNLLVCSRLVVDKSARRSGSVSLALMRATYYYGREAGIKVCLCHTIPDLYGYFSRFGFRAFAQPFHDRMSGRIQVPLVLFLEDVPHLMACDSPFLIEAAARENTAPEAHWTDAAVG